MKNYIERTFRTIFNEFDDVEDFLSATCDRVAGALARDHQCPEELLFYPTVAWLEDNKTMDEGTFLSRINFCLFDLQSLVQLQDNDRLLSTFSSLNQLVAAAVGYHQLSLDKRISHWDRNTRTRWPKILVAASTGDGRLMFKKRTTMDI